MSRNPVVIGKNDEFLRAALRRLEGFLAAPFDGYAQSWAVRLGGQLAAVAAALNDAGGADHPLYSQIQNLRQELQAIAQPFADSPKIVDLLEIRRRIRLLVTEIQRFTEEEPILPLESVNVAQGS